MERGIILLLKVCIQLGYSSYTCDFFLRIICCAMCLSQVCNKKNLQMHYKFRTCLLSTVTSFQIVYMILFNAINSVVNLEQCI